MIFSQKKRALWVNNNESAATLKLLFVGDVMLGRLVNDELNRRDVDYPWGDTLPFFKEADLRICNLECVISDRGRPWSRTPKVFHFRLESKNLCTLKAAEIDAVSLANNHTLDFDYSAMFDMLRQLDKAGVSHAGAGHNLEAAANPAIINLNGSRIGFISFTDNQPEWEARPSDPGLFYVPTDLRDARAIQLLELVRHTRQRVDLLVVATHWGGNWGYAPPPEHVQFGRALITAGAEIVIGHSAHVFRGVEIFHGGLIIYSAGNFIDDYAVDSEERNDQSFIFVVDTDGAKLLRLRLRPTVIRNFQAKLACEEEEFEIAAKMTKLCAQLGTRLFWDNQAHCLIAEVMR